MLEQDQIQQINKDGDRTYRVEANGQIYDLVSVTTVIGYLLNKPALLPWGYNVGIEETLNYLQEQLNQLIGHQLDSDDIINTIHGITDKDIKQKLKEQDRTYDSRKIEGQTRGITVHAALEAIIQGEEPTVPPEYYQYIIQLHNFMDDYEPEFLASELKVASLEHGYAGTLDTVAIIHKHPPRRRHESLVGMKLVIDVKTNKEGSVYPMAHLPQVGGYEIAYEETTADQVDGGMIVALGKESYQPCPSYMEPNVFLKILDAYNAVKDGIASNPNARKKRA